METKELTVEEETRLDRVLTLVAEEQVSDYADEFTMRRTIGFYLGILPPIAGLIMVYFSQTFFHTGMDELIGIDLPIVTVMKIYCIWFAAGFCLFAFLMRCPECNHSLFQNTKTGPVIRLYPEACEQCGSILS